MGLTREELVNQLIDIYYKEEDWHNHKLIRSEAEKYHNKLLDENRIYYCVKDNKVIGYAETWRLNREQISRIIRKQDVCAYLEDVSSGDVCYIANWWVDKNHRNGDVFIELRDMIRDNNIDCLYFMGDRGKDTKVHLNIRRR